MSWAPTAGELGEYLRQKNGAPEELMTRTGSTDGFNEEMGWLPGYEGGEAAGDGFDTAFYAEAASAQEYAQRYGEDGQAQRESALKQLEGTGYEELVMQGLQAEQNSAYREKAAAFLESFMKGEYIPDVQLGELWQSAQAWKRQRTQAANRQDTAVQTAVANTAREGLNPVPGTAYNESMPNAAEGLTVGESLTEGAGGVKPVENGSYIKDGKPNGRPQLSGEKKLQFENDVYNNNVDPDGILRDPNTGDVIDWKPGQSRKDVVDFGHKTGNSYNDMFQKYKNGENTLDELKKFQFDPNNYRLEIPSANRSHKYE